MTNLGLDPLGTQVLSRKYIRSDGRFNIDDRKNLRVSSTRFLKIKIRRKLRTHVRPHVRPQVPEFVQTHPTSAFLIGERVSHKQPNPNPNPVMKRRIMLVRGLRYL